MCFMLKTSTSVRPPHVSTAARASMASTATRARATETILTIAVEVASYNTLLTNAIIYNYQTLMCHVRSNSTMFNPWT